MYRFTKPFLIPMQQCPIKFLPAWQKSELLLRQAGHRLVVAVADLAVVVVVVAVADRGKK